MVGGDGWRGGRVKMLECREGRVNRNAAGVTGCFENRLVEGESEMKRCPHLAATRNTQLDGWRAFAVAGVMWHHWAPESWKGPIPFELGLFFFLTLTGFLITRILLRERAAGEQSGEGWRVRAYRGFQQRRLARILAPCYAAMVFAVLVGASDIRNHPLPYFAHVSNFHMATMDGWPSGTAHYWTLAIQMQFYLLWPAVVFLIPRRMLAGVFIGCVVLAPVSRVVIDVAFPGIHHAEAITSSAFDYFGMGALLALVFERGVSEGDRRISIAAWVAFVCYIIIYGMNEAGRPLPYCGPVQQTFLAVALVGLISATLAGFNGKRRVLLDHPVVQHVGKLSYGLYLFHTPVPLLLGWVIPQLWKYPVFDGPLLIVRLAVFAVVSWGAAWLCWRWLEGPDRLRFPRLFAGSKP